MNGEVLIPLAGIAMIVAIVLGPVWLKSRERREMQEVLRTAIDKGQPLPSDVIDSLSRQHVKPPATATRDLRVGVILLAVATGVALTFGILGTYADDEMYPAMAMAAIPGMIGLAFIVLSVFNKNKG